MMALRLRVVISLVSCIIVMLSAQAHPDDGCYAGDVPLCSPASASCAYRTYSAGGAFTESADADADGWQDGCDAFPADSSEWADLDGDGDGHHADCNDLDPSLQGCEPADSNEATASQETADDSRGSASPIFAKNTRMLRPVPCHPHWECGAWSACAEGVVTRTCRDAWACQTDEGRPATVQACAVEEVVSGEPLGQPSTELAPEATLAPPPAPIISSVPVPSESWWALIAATLVLLLVGMYHGVRRP